MRPERFTSGLAGRPVQIAIRGEAYWAFAPHPLQSGLPIEPEWVRALSDADRAFGELAGVARSMPEARQLAPLLARREAVSSARLSGGRGDLVALYAHEGGVQGEEVEQEDWGYLRVALSYLKAYEYGLQRLPTLPVSLRLLHELHECVVEGDVDTSTHPGEFRGIQTWLGYPDGDVHGAVYVPPPVPEMREALNALDRYLARPNGYPPLVSLAVTHYHFEAIHPFMDANGRVGRLLIPLFLAQWAIIPVPLFYMSTFFERNRDEYYSTLQAVSERGAWREWLLFFFRGVVEQSQETCTQAERLRDLRAEWRQRLQQPRASELTSQIALSMFEKPVLAAEEISERFGVTPFIAWPSLQRLEEIGILQEISGRERNRVYMAREIVKVAE